MSALDEPIKLKVTIKIEKGYSELAEDSVEIEMPAKLMQNLDLDFLQSIAKGVIDEGINKWYDQYRYGG